MKDLGGEIGEVKSMRTHPDHLRRGVASALLEHIIDEARRRGMRRLSLETGRGPAFEAALKKNNVQYTMHMYENTNHGFHNNSTPRYDEPAAKLAWERTVEFFKEQLKG